MKDKEVEILHESLIITDECNLVVCGVFNDEESKSTIQIRHKEILESKDFKNMIP